MRGNSNWLFVVDIRSVLLLPLTSPGEVNEDDNWLHAQHLPRVLEDEADASEAHDEEDRG